MGSSIAQFRLHGIVWQFGSGANRLSICTIRQQFLMFKAPSACEDAFAEIFGGHIMATRCIRMVKVKVRCLLWCCWAASAGLPRDVAVPNELPNPR